MVQLLRDSLGRKDPIKDADMKYKIELAVTIPRLDAKRYFYVNLPRHSDDWMDTTTALLDELDSYLVETMENYFEHRDKC